MYHTRPWSLQRQALEPETQGMGAMLDHLDRGVGSMVDLLEQLEILDNTIIFFAGDNGYSHWGYFGRPLHQDDPLFKNKGPWPKGKFTSTHEGGVRVPFFVYWKDKVQGGENDHICALYDVLATAADLAGVNPENRRHKFCTDIIARPNEQQTHEYPY